MSATEWTTTTPTEPGFYWAIDLGGELLVMELDIYYFYGTRAQDVDPDDIQFWLGPMAEPERPK